MANEILDEEITQEEAVAALKVAGLEMSEAEIEMLLPALEEYREAYAGMRETPLDNGVSPTLEFDPRPEGFAMPTEDRFAVRYSSTSSGIASDSSNLAFASVLQLYSWLRSGELSSVELTRYFLNRLRTHNQTLHCVISLTEELALEQAARADAELAAGNDRGFLHGIPYGAKDLLATKQYLTTWGATPYQDQSFDYDATAIEKMEEAGAVLVAKLTLGALAWGDVWYGEMTRNPWDPTTGSSGSSAGSASAVSAGLVPFALGTETLGSIVSPSTVCGVTGLRPTFGRVSRYGAMTLSWTMDKIGPITRSARDAILVLNELNGRDDRDPFSIQAPLNYDSRDEQPLRIGYVAADFDQAYPFKSQDSLTLLKLEELGYELIPVELPELPPIRSILEVEAAAAFDELTRSGRDDELVRQVTNAWPNVFRTARFVPAVEYVQANRHRRLLMKEMAEVFKAVDLYVHPSWASRSLVITNFTGHPCITIPNGVQENGLPTSITFTGGLFEEGEIVRVAQEYQDASQWDDSQPEGF
ncbi:MAG: amidase [Bacteroidota bacterium]